MTKLLRKNKPGGRPEWTTSGSFISRPTTGWLHPDEQLASHAGICYGVRVSKDINVIFMLLVTLLLCVWISIPKNGIQTKL